MTSKACRAYTTGSPASTIPRPGGTVPFPTSPDAEPRALRVVVEGIQRIPSAFTGDAVGW